VFDLDRALDGAQAVEQVEGERIGITHGRPYLQER
jgi:hypothetical protein